MAKVGAQRAAELSGKSKSTIQRAMKNGKISYEMDKNGRRVIDVAEIERAFGIVPQASDKQEHRAVEAELEKAKQTLELERLKMRIKLLEEKNDMLQSQIDDTKDQRDQWQKQAQQTLLTSEYSQRQAEEFREEIKEQKKAEEMRRRQAMERRQAMQNKVQTIKTSNQNKGSEGSEEAKNFDIQKLWSKIRGQDEDSQKVA
jgi:vacuolar-type H+-ATPase subunit I/STV1